MRRITLAQVSTFNVNRGIFQTNSRLSSWKRSLMITRARRGRPTTNQSVFRRPWKTVGILYGIRLVRVFDNTAFPSELRGSRVDPPLGYHWHWVFDNLLGWCRFHMGTWNCWRYSSSDTVGDERSLVLPEYGGTPWPNVSSVTVCRAQRKAGWWVFFSIVWQWARRDSILFSLQTCEDWRIRSYFMMVQIHQNLML